MVTRQSSSSGRIFMILAVALLAGCGSSGSQSASTGTITAKLPRGPAGKSSAKSAALAFAGIAALRILLSAAERTITRNSFSAESGSGAVDGVPAGTGRRLTAQGRDQSRSVIYQGPATDLAVQAVRTTDAGRG